MTSTAGRVAGWPRVTAQQLAARELARRRPSIDIPERGTIGMRDTIIWEGLIELLEQDVETTAIFVTNDKGFLEGEALHPHLLEDLDTKAIARDRVRVQTTTYAAVIDVRGLLGQINQRETALSKAMVRLIGGLQELDWGGWWDPRDGGKASAEDGLPDLPHYIDNPHVTLVEFIEIESIGTGDPATCVAYANVEVDGDMNPVDYLSDAYDVEWWGGELGDASFDVHATLPLCIEAKIRYLGDGTTKLIDKQYSWAEVPATDGENEIVVDRVEV